MKSIRFFIPMPLQIVIDDVGWWCGEDGSARQEPYRTGMPRNHVPADYEAVVSLGRQLGMRPQAAMILCEWDRGNILGKLPSATWMGAQWDNRRWIGPWIDEAADIILRNRDHFELTLHGVGHEYWQAGRFTRAEWHDEKGAMRPHAEVIAHLDSYQALLDHNGLGAFPESFVPCAFKHAFGRGEQGIAAILRDRGLKFISTPFMSLVADTPPQEKLFGIDAGLMTVDRGFNGVEWNEVGPEPWGDAQGPVYGLHWPNILHEDPARNSEVVDRWVHFFHEYDRRPDAMLAPNTAACWTQLAYQTCTEVEIRERVVHLDFTRLNRLAPLHLLDWFTIKVEANCPIRLFSRELELTPLPTADGHGSRSFRARRIQQSTHAELELAPVP